MRGGRCWALRLRKTTCCGPSPASVARGARGGARRSAAYVPQDPNALLFSPTVRSGGRRPALSPVGRRRRRRPRAVRYASRPSPDASRGALGVERQRVAVAAVAVGGAPGSSTTSRRAALTCRRATPRSGDPRARERRRSGGPGHPRVELAARAPPRCRTRGTARPWPRPRARRSHARSSPPGVLTCRPPHCGRGRGRHRRSVSRDSRPSIPVAVTRRRRLAGGVPLPFWLPDGSVHGRSHGADAPLKAAVLVCWSWPSGAEVRQGTLTPPQRRCSALSAAPADALPTCGGCKRIFSWGPRGAALGAAPRPAPRALLDGRLGRAHRGIGPWLPSRCSVRPGWRGAGWLVRARPSRPRAEVVAPPGKGGAGGSLGATLN